MLKLNIKIGFFILLIGFAPKSYGQIAWTWTELNPMPFQIANNAVTYGTIAGQDYVYSFGGIDTTKIYSGISQRSFRYEVASDTWLEIAPLPSSLENIAASASTVKNKIYIIGGYHVYSSGSETSSNEVIIYNPETDLYESNGTSIPTAIDDHVHCVYKDSLIYIITGWSNTTNVPNVQIYDPELDQWTVGTSMPNNTIYKVFGGSGEIIGDTIYYFGGARTGGNFPATSNLRKGIIDPNDPTQITWTLEDVGPNDGYRQACLKHEKNLFWVGGSSTSYNYNGIAYNGTGGVNPLMQIMRYQALNKYWDSGFGTPYGVMDMRGSAQISPTQWVICGGMESSQQVSDKTYLLTYDPVVGGTYVNDQVSFAIINRKIISNQKIISAKVYTINGKLISHIDIESLEISNSITGFIIIEIVTEYGWIRKKVVL